MAPKSRRRLATAADCCLVVCIETPIARKNARWSYLLVRASYERKSLLVGGQRSTALYTGRSNAAAALLVLVDPAPQVP